MITMPLLVANIDGGKLEIKFFGKKTETGLYELLSLVYLNNCKMYNVNSPERLQEIFNLDKLAFKKLLLKYNANLRPEGFVFKTRKEFKNFFDTFLTPLCTEMKLLNMPMRYKTI